MTAYKRNAEPILAVATVAKWHAWLAARQKRSQGVLLRIAKVHDGDDAPRSMTYAEALDVALAWGWIDSQKRALDASAWLQRFTPRKAKSPWSRINRAKAEALIVAGKMEPPGLAEIERAK